MSSRIFGYARVSSKDQNEERQLKAFKDYEVKDINRVAQFYTEEFKTAGLDKKLVLPEIKNGFTSSWAQYTVQLPLDVNRSELQAKLKEAGIPSMVYYAGTDSAIADCPVTERLAKTVLSLPLHPYMDSKEVSFVVQKIKEALA